MCRNGNRAGHLRARGGRRKGLTQAAVGRDASIRTDVGWLIGLCAGAGKLCSAMMSLRAADVACFPCSEGITDPMASRLFDPGAGRFAGVAGTSVATLSFDGIVVSSSGRDGPLRTEPTTSGCRSCPGRLTPLAMRSAFAMEPTSRASEPELERDFFKEESCCCAGSGSSVGSAFSPLAAAALPSALAAAENCGCDAGPSATAGGPEAMPHSRFARPVPRRTGLARLSTASALRSFRRAVSSEAALADGSWSWRLHRRTLCGSAPCGPASFGWLSGPAAFRCRAPCRRTLTSRCFVRRRTLDGAAWKQVPEWPGRGRWSFGCGSEHFVDLFEFFARVEHRRVGGIVRIEAASRGRLRHRGIGGRGRDSRCSGRRGALRRRRRGSRSR